MTTLYKWRKLAGVHYKREVNGEEKEYKPGDVMEATEEYIKKYDPLITSWRKIEEVKPEERMATLVRGTAVTRNGIIAVEREDREGWDVVGRRNGKVVKTYNTEPLDEARARELAATFSK